jgi:hypothetical protein
MRIEPSNAEETIIKPSNLTDMHNMLEEWRPIQNTLLLLQFAKSCVETSSSLAWFPWMTKGGPFGKYANKILFEFTWKNMISRGRPGMNSKLPHWTSTAFNGNMLLLVVGQYGFWFDVQLLFKELGSPP